ncbi:TVP38/TMEM64 family protein [Arabiibacter massiliensis]|uniref:TVP38/TMEM64 family protein n=1 Tax=Arabiibacter massiliensis TaxID=1870985 RepID=UPI0009BB3AC6|nr:VTT domain-containing protein [Arabiibacter massiliensis]
MDDEKRLRRERIVVIAVLAAVLAAVVVLLALHGREALAFLTDGHLVQQQVERLGPLAPVALGALVVLQEVTIIVPSEPLELAAGYAFGFWEGALVYLAASVVGCIAIILIVRRWGDKVLKLFLSPKRRAQLARLERSQRFDLAILVAFFIPGLPKDVMAYFAALAGMGPAHLVAVTTVGRLPSVVAATLASSYAAAGDWRATAIVFAVTAALVLAGMLVYHGARRRSARKPDDNA